MISRVAVVGRAGAGLLRRQTSSSKTPLSRAGFVAPIRARTLTSAARFSAAKAPSSDVVTPAGISARSISTTAVGRNNKADNMSSDGKITNWVNPNDRSGEFKRQVSSFRDFISNEPGARFPAEKGRYHLYVSYACPWANRTLIARKLKGLEDIVSFSVVHWHLGEKGWRFVTAEDDDAPGENVIPDPVKGHEKFTHIRDIYFQAEPNYSGRFTVPVLYDKIQQTIVNNESSEILRMFGTEFDHLVDQKYRKVVLYPEALREQIEEAHGWMYDKINNGVYKSGFATTQEAYERNVLALFEALDRAEDHLASRSAADGPYYLGKELTEVDVRLFVTIIRFDPVYVQHFKCNIRSIRDGYPALHRWMRNLYWNHAAFKDTTNFLHIKNHYTRSHTQINPYSITPVGPLPDILPLDKEVPAVVAALAGKL